MRWWETTRGCCRMVLLALCVIIISTVSLATMAHNVAPEKLHLKAWVPLPDGKLILLVRDTQALHLPEGTSSCTSLDGPHCIDARKSNIYNASPWPRAAGAHAPQQAAQKDVKIRVLATTLKPGQTVEEAVQEELRRAEEKKSLLAESVSAREGTTPEEARKALELAELEDGNAIQLNLDDLDSFLDTISQMVEASGTTDEDDISRMMQVLRSATDMSSMSTANDDDEDGDNGEDYADDEYRNYDVDLYIDDEDDDYDEDDYLDDYDEGDYNDDDYDDEDDYAEEDNYDEDDVEIGEDDPL